MIDARELRIGNIVESYGTNGAPSHWVELSVKAMHIQTCDSSPELFRPIPITEEWLVKFGFRSINNVWQLFPIELMDGPNGYEFFHRALGGGKFKTITYVHQLQNLYFALTDSELTIN